MKKLFTILILLLIWAGSSWAQTTVTITCTGTAGSYNSGSVSSAGVMNDGNMININTSANRGWARYDLSTIPLGAVVSSVTANFTTYSSTSSSALNNLYGFLGDPATMGGTVLYTACATTPSFNNSSWTANALNSKAFNAAGNSFISANAGSFVNIGYVRASTNNYNIYGYSGTTPPNLVITYTVAPNLIVSPGSLAFGYIPFGNQSAPLTYTLTGYNLTDGPIVVTPPTGFEVSLDGLAWSASVSVTYTPPTLASTTIYVRFNPTSANANFSGNVTNVGGGGTANVAVSGSSYEHLKWCTSNATSTADEEIFNVTAGTLNNTSDCNTTAPGPGSIKNQYSNYYYDVAPPVFQRTTSPAFSVQIGTCGGIYSNALKIFIDFNQDGDFADANEQVYVSPTSTSGAHTETGLLSIPVDAALGYTMMRVVNVETSSPAGISACGTYSWGETEDYKVQIAEAPACPPPSSLTALAYGYQATLGWTENGTATTWDLEWGPQGFVQGTGTLVLGITPLPTYLLLGLTPSTNYAYYVRSACNVKDNSTWSGPKNFTTTVSCPQPTGVSATNPTKTTIDVNWTEAGLATEWNIQYGPAGFVLGTGTILYTTTIPTQVTGLAASTTYGFYVQAICGADSSAWSGPVTNTTLCEVETLPFGPQTFAGTTFPPVCWSKYTGVLAAPSTLLPGGSWIQDDWRNITSPVNKAARLNIWSTGVYSWLMTPQIDLGAGSATLNLEFDLTLNAYGTSGPPGTTGVDDKFAVVISTDGGVTWTSANTLRLWDNAGSTYVYNNINPAGEHIVLNLSGYSGIVMFGFYGESTISNADNDLMIDNVVVQEPPACPAPTGLLATTTGAYTASISWSGAATVDIDYGPVGHPAGTGTLLTGITANPYALGGLAANTSYDVFIRQSCGGGIYSTWSGPASFTTFCETAAIPFSENFTAATFPSCWTQTSTLSNVWTVSATAIAGGTANEMKATWVSGLGVSRLITPPLNTTGMTQLALSFRQFFDDYAAGVTYKVQSSADGISWTDEAWTNASGSGNTGPALVNTTVVNNLGGTTYIAWVLDGDHYNLDYWYIDDVNITVPLANDAATLSIGLASVYEPGTVNPTASVQNKGLNPETFPVTLTIGTYTSTVTVTGLAPGATQVVNFDPWNATLGSYTAQVCTGLVGDMDPSNDCLSKPVDVMVLTKYYAYNTFTDQVGYFYREFPGTWTSLAASTSAQFIGAGTWANDIWYGSEYYDGTTGGGWYKIDASSGGMTLIASLAKGFTGITYDYSTNTMYGVEWTGTTNNLYTIDPPTGAYTLLGTVGGAELYINLATNSSGLLYSIGISTDHLFSINPTTLVTVDIGACGQSMNYAQDMEYDYNNNTMYAAAYTTGGALYTVDLGTGAMTLVGPFAGNAEMCGFAIPYTTAVPKVVNLKVYLEGLYNGTGNNQAYNELGPQWPYPIADKVTLELRSSVDGSLVLTINNVDLNVDGSISVSVDASYSGDYYIYMYHRNHLVTSTAVSFDFSLSGAITYDMTTGVGQAFGSNMKDIGGVAVIFAGDTDQSTGIDSSDMILVDNDNAIFATGYLVTDVDGNGGVDSSDMILVDNNNAAFVSAILPF